MISSTDNLSSVNLNCSACIDIFFNWFVRWKTCSSWMVFNFEYGREVYNNSKLIPSGLITDICNNGDPEYSDENK